ncbi:hypothetical protein NC653_017845 [Populus alba x Populus x berolinensis]|uniref:Uncharacterized protein n=1 Tax=Populus alba x Populus x berolinensis TaxID=444605 RepID=A0AAD6QRA6_9ROSI|nr:hypothetical protein NC653_017845 [Populus alba x Populus x berolinensis]
MAKCHNQQHRFFTPRPTILDHRHWNPPFRRLWETSSHRTKFLMLSAVGGRLTVSPLRR